MQEANRVIHVCCVFLVVGDALLLRKELKKVFIK